MNKRRLCWGVGVALVLSGVAVPSATWVALFRDGSPGELLLQGAALFRAALVANGLVACLLAWRAPGGFDAPEKSGAARLTRREWIGLGTLLAVALALRLYKLGDGIWYDEIAAWVAYMHLTPGEIFTTYDSQTNHIVFTTLAKFAFLVFGESVASMRLPAVLFGVASIGATFALARRVAGVREAWLSAALMTVSYHHLWFSQNARGYTGLMLWTIVCTDLLLRLLDGGRKSLWIAYALAAAVGALTHMSMALIVAGHVVVCVGVMVKRARDGAPTGLRALVGGFALTALVAFQFQALVLPQFLSIRNFGGPRDHVATWNDPLWTMLETLRSVIIGVGVVPALGGGTLLLLGLISFTRRRAIFPWLVVVPAMLAGGAMLAAGYTLFPRFFLFDLGFVMLLLVRGGMVVGALAARLVPPLRERALVSGTAVCVLMCAASAWMMPVAYLPKQDFAGPLEYLDAQARPEETIVTVGLATRPYQQFYETGWLAAETADDIAVAQSSGPVWLVYTIPIHLREARPEIMALIESDFDVRRSFGGTLGGGAVVVCRTRDP